MKVDNAISLDDHDDMVKSKKEGKHNGIKCPVCEHVLHDTKINIQLKVHAEMYVACTNGECAYTGTRLI